MTTSVLGPKNLDLANHHPDSTEANIRDLFQKVQKFGFNAAFVNPFYVSLARELLTDKGKVGTVISFPLGQELLRIKCLSAIEAISAGADELDISLNVGLIKARNWEASLFEMTEIVKVVR